MKFIKYVGYIKVLKYVGYITILRAYYVHITLRAYYVSVIKNIDIFSHPVLMQSCLREQGGEATRWGRSFTTSSCGTTKTNEKEEAAAQPIAELVEDARDLSLMQEVHGQT